MLHGKSTVASKKIPKDPSLVEQSSRSHLYQVRPATGTVMEEEEEIATPEFAPRTIFPTNRRARTLVITPIQSKSSMYMKIHCTFCGGKTCKHEDYRRTIPNEAMKMAHLQLGQVPLEKYYVFEGLNSHFVVQNVIASQRPSSSLIKRYNIIEQFKEQNVVAIVNLQEQGEHPYCGDGILAKTGFSYDPEEDIMKHKSMLN